MLSMLLLMQGRGNVKYVTVNAGRGNVKYVTFIAGEGQC